MGALISQQDIDLVRSIYPLLEIKPFTGQQEMLLYQHLKGNMTQRAAAAAAGMSISAAEKFLRREDVQAVVAVIRDSYRQALGVSREQVTAMLLESYSKAATATEEIMAAREVAKLHGLYESDRIAAEAHERRMGDSEKTLNAKKMRSMSDDQLLAWMRSQGDDVDLDPHPEAEEAQYTEVGPASSPQQKEDA